MIRYLDTRGASDSPRTFTEAILEGIAPGGGLFVPERLPRFTQSSRSSRSRTCRTTRARRRYRGLRPRRRRRRRAEVIAARAYGPNFDRPEIAPVVEVGSGHPRARALARPHAGVQGHGAAVHAALLLGGGRAAHAEGGRLDDDYLILVATSGDTGKAALEGFADRAHTTIVVFYPADGVSRHPATADGHAARRRTWACSASAATSTTARARSRPSSTTSDFDAELHGRHGSASELGQLHQLGAPAARRSSTT